MIRIDDIIMDYSKELKPKYALLIDGKWGEGKTYFLKNTIAQKLLASKKEFYYVTLNGIEDTSEIFSQLISEKLNRKTFGISKSRPIKVIANLITPLASVVSSTI